MSQGAITIERAGVGLPERFYAIGAEARSRYVCFAQTREALEIAFGPANPWFGTSEGALLWGEGARLAVFAPAGLRVDGERAGFFGFFESIGGEGEGDEVSRLIGAVRAWGRRRGLSAMYGPIDFSTFGPYRLKLREEEGGLPFLSEPQNPVRYADLLRGGARRSRRAT